MGAYLEYKLHTFVRNLLHWPLEIWYMGAYPGVGAFPRTLQYAHCIQANVPTVTAEFAEPRTMAVSPCRSLLSCIYYPTCTCKGWSNRSVHLSSSLLSTENCNILRFTSPSKSWKAQNCQNRQKKWHICTHACFSPSTSTTNCDIYMPRLFATPTDATQLLGPLWLCMPEFCIGNGRQVTKYNSIYRARAQQCTRLD